MFKPIIHNLRPGDIGYSECQLYNNIISNKPKGQGTLASKISRERAWKEICAQALEKVNLTLKGI